MKRKTTTLIILGTLFLGLTLSSCDSWLDRGEITYGNWATLSMTYKEDGLPNVLSILLQTIPWCCVL